MPPKGGNKHKQSVVLLEEGGRRTIEELVFSRPLAREGSESCFVTWSWPKEGGGLTKPSQCERHEFGRKILESLAAIQGRDTKLARTIFHLLIAREPHTTSPGVPDPERYHYHAVVISDVQVNYWDKLGAEMRDTHNVAAEVRIAHDKRPVDRMCFYILAPTGSKPLTDCSPWVSASFPFPAAVLENVRKVRGSIRKKAASTSDLWSIVLESEELVRPTALRSLVDMKLLQIERAPADENIDGLDIRYRQVSNYFSRYGPQALETINEMLSRRDTQKYVGSLGRPLAHFHAAALQDECLCTGTKNLFRSMCAGLTLQAKGRSNWHACPKPIETIGQWFIHMMEQSFPDRRRTLLVQGGPGSGKSTLANMILLLYPPFFVSSAAWGDSFVWGDVREETLMLDLADLRLGWAEHFAPCGCTGLEQHSSRS
jgi:hypothetical protein